MMTVGRALATALALGILPLSAQAQADPAGAFVNSDDYRPAEVQALEARIADSLPAVAPSASVLLPTAGIGPIPMAMLALAASEPELERVRYRIGYGVEWIEEGSLPLSFIEVIRFNIGPAIRADLVDAMGEDAVVGPEEFGAGPHVGWRLVTQPVMGNRAIVVAAGRSEISEDTAAGMTCMGTPCLAPHSSFEELAPWAEMTEIDVDLDAPYPIADAMGLTPLAAVDFLLGHIDSLEFDAIPEGAPSIPEPAIEALVDANLGQDHGLEAAYRWGGLLDDSLAAIWQRMAAFPIGDEDFMSYGAKTYECARGPQFPEPGALCP